MKENGYEFHLIYLWLPSSELAIERVAERVRQGGHDIPSATIQRRFNAGLRNFFDLYSPLADTWSFYLNIVPGIPNLIADFTSNVIEVHHTDAWEDVLCRVTRR